MLPDGRPLEITVETAGEDTEQADVLQLIHDTWLDEPVRSAIGRADTERWASGPVALQDQP